MINKEAANKIQDLLSVIKTKNNDLNEINTKLNEVLIAKEATERNLLVSIKERDELALRIDLLGKENQKYQGDVEFFKGIINSQNERRENSTKSREQDSELITTLKRENEGFNSKLKEYELKIETLTNDYEFLK